MRKFYSLYLGELFEEVGQPRKVQIGVRLDLVLEAQLNLKKDITTRILHQILEKKYELSICCRHLWDQIKHQKEETMQPIKVVKLGLSQSIFVQKYELQTWFSFNTSKPLASLDNSPIHKQYKQGNLQPYEGQGGGG